MSSSKQKVGRPGVAGQEAKKKDVSGRGSRCSQSEAYEPLKGKSFYLDVRRQAAKLKKDLEDLGGVVETFLSKDISYVVSDRPEVKLECTKDARQSTASPAVSTPSPFQQSRDSAHGAVDSPSASGGGREGMVTRGKAIVQKATISHTYGTSNVLANARNWDVSIRHIDSVIKYVNKEKQKMKDSGVKPSQTQAPAVKDRASLSKERKLSKPSLKVEDATRHYRPASKELTAWPRMSFDGHSTGCPFDLAAPAHSRDKRTVVAAQGGRTQHRPDDNRERGEAAVQTRPGVKAALRGKRNAQLLYTPSRQKDVGVKDSRRGYCECCLIKYSDLEKHLASEQHRNFVRENNHYVNLDLMIDEGPNIQQFLDDVMHHHEWQRLEGMRSLDVPDEVTLVSSPSLKKSKNPLKEPERPCQLTELRGEAEEQASAGSNTKSSQGQGTAENRGHPQQVGQSALSTKSPRRRSNRLQSAAVQDEAASAVSSTAAPEGMLEASSKRVEPVMDDRQTGAGSIQDSQQHDRDIVCALPSSEKQLSRDLVGSQSPPMRNLRRHPGQIQKSSPAAPVVVPSAEQHVEAGGQSPQEVGGKRLPTGSPSPRGTPATPSRRQSSRLSLSARRRQQEQHTKSPSEVPSVLPETMPSQETSAKQPADPQGDSQERVNISGHTPNTINKRPRSNRLSLTARKRLLKESAQSRPDPQCVLEDTGAGVDERLKDQTQIQAQVTPTETDLNQEMGMNSTGKETGKQKRGEIRDSPKPAKRSSKRKRDTDDVPDLGSSKNPKQRITNTHYQAHVQQKQTGRCSNRNKGTLEEHKTGEATHQSENDPPRMEGSSQNRVDQDNAEDNRVQEPAGTSGACRKALTEEPNLESIFQSDPNVVQSSFLGFDSEDITETEQRLQQLSASPTTYTSKLQEAALSVFCIPSSELQLPEDDDSSSSSSAMSNMEEVCVGMALRNLQNFPSEGSEWEFNVGGFMSVRLDKAMQVKESESLLAKKCLQEKENQYRQVLNIPSKLNPVGAREQENATRQLDHPLKKTQSATKNSPSRKDDARLRTENRSRSLDPGLTLPRRALSYGPTLKTASHRQNHDAKNQAKPLQSPKNDPVRVVSPNRRVTFSPQKPVCSTPKRAPDNRQFKLMFSPETPKEDREIIEEHYIHDLTEDEIDFPKFSSPRHSESILSPIKKFAKSRPKKRRRSASDYKLNAPQVLRELPHCGSPRKSLFPRRRHSTSSTPSRVFHFLLNPPGSPRKRESSPSLPSSPVKQAVTNLAQALRSPEKQQQLPPPDRESLHQITYFPANERSKVSPTFCTNAKPNFSSHILQPCNKKRRSDRLRSSVGQPAAPSSPLRRQPTRTWSMCVSFDDDICCSEDVYEFTESTDGDTDSTTQQSNAGQNPAIKDNSKKLSNAHSGKTSRKGKSKARRNTRAKKEAQPSDSSDQVVQEFGLPFSFFM